MLPTSRILSALLAGLGVALVVAGLLAPRVLIDGSRLPLTLGNATWTVHDPDGTKDGNPAPVTHQLHMDIQNPSNGDVASVRVGDTLRAGESGSDFDDLVSASTWSFQLDRVTGEAKGPADVQLVMAMPSATVPVEGVWLKFPSPVKRDAVAVFDPVLRGSAAAEFVGEEEIAGRTVYRFRQEIAPTNVAMRYADMRNTLTVEGERTFLFHTALRELLVDQVTGVVVGIDEKVDDFYGTLEGRGVQNVVTYDGAMDRAQTEEILGRLDGSNVAGGLLVGRWVVVGIGALLSALGLIGALRPGRSSTSA